jgi:hypothetical protein
MLEVMVVPENGRTLTHSLDQNITPSQRIFATCAMILLVDEARGVPN